MLYDAQRVEDARQLVRAMSSAELADLVSLLSSDYTTDMHSTMGTMVWLFNTAPCNRANMEETPYRTQALYKAKDK